MWNLLHKALGDTHMGVLYVLPRRRTSRSRLFGLAGLADTPPQSG
jgi:hypothetical protein